MTANISSRPMGTRSYPQDIGDNVKDLAQSTSAGRVVAILDQAAKVGVWEYPSLNLVEWITLPEFALNKRQARSLGRFVFVNAAGTHYLVIAGVNFEYSDTLYDSLIIGDMP
jgi:hypothetical protein